MKLLTDQQYRDILHLLTRGMTDKYDIEKAIELLKRAESVKWQ